MTTETTTTTERGPIVAIMGHIDHGKSTLLSYIRKSSEPLNEAGGITQHISAYEVIHEAADGKKHSITFIDTPGHEAFSGIRKRAHDSSPACCIAGCNLLPDNSPHVIKSDCFTEFDYLLPYRNDLISPIIN